MTDVIHLDPTGMSLGSTGSADERVVRAAQAVDAQNLAGTTACGLPLAGLEYRGEAEISEVTCLNCLGEYEHDPTAAGGERSSGSET